MYFFRKFEAKKLKFIKFSTNRNSFMIQCSLVTVKEHLVLVNINNDSEGSIAYVLNNLLILISRNLP